MDEQKKSGNSQNSVSYNPKPSTSCTSEEEIDLDVIKPKDNYILKKVKRVTKQGRIMWDNFQGKTEKKHQKPMQYDLHYSVVDEQADNKVLPDDNVHDLPSTYLDVSRSSEQARNINPDIQQCREESEGEKRVFTTLKHLFPEDVNRSTKIEGATKKSRNVTRNSEKQGKEKRLQNNDACKSLDRKKISTLIESFCGHSGVAQFGNITSHNVPTKSTHLQDDYSAHSRKTVPHNLHVSTALSSVITPHIVAAHYSRSSAVQSGKTTSCNMPTQNYLQEAYLHGSAAESSVMVPHSASMQVMNLQDVFPLDSAVQSRNTAYHNMPIQEINLQDYPCGSSTQSQNTTLQSLSALGQIDNAINSLKEKSQTLMNCKSELETEVKEIIPTTVALSSECSLIGNPNIPFNDEKESTDLSEWDMVDGNIQNELTNVDNQTVAIDDFQNQLTSFSREEKDNLYAAKGKIFADKLKNLPEQQRKEAEGEILHILYKSELAARMKEMQEGSYHNATSLKRTSLDIMCKEASAAANQKLISPIKVRSGSKSPYRGKIYPHIPEFKEQNGNFEDENNFVPDFQNQRFQQDSEDESLSDEQDFTQDVVEQHTMSSHIPTMSSHKPAKSPKISCVPECEKRLPHLVAPKYRKEPSPQPTVPYMYVKEILFALAVIVIAVTAVVFGPIYWPKIQEMFPKTGAPPEHSVASIIENLKDEFSGQPSMTFKIISSALRRVTEPNPEAPAIIVLLAELGAEDIAGRFARKVAESVTSPSNIVVISGHTYQSQDQDTAKKDIDNLIKDNLKEDQFGAVLVDRLDYIPAGAAMILHTYCDHENAPFKRAVYVMTIVSKKTGLKSNNPKEWDAMVQDHLYESWSTGEDQISSLLSRLTVSVAAIVSVDQ